MIKTISEKERAFKSLLDLFTGSTDLPIKLYLVGEENLIPVSTEMSVKKNGPYCESIWKLDGGKILCDDDQCERANKIFRDGIEALTICHAGLYNQVVPIRVGGDVKCILSYGKMILEEENNQKRSLEKFNALVEKFGLTTDEKKSLQDVLMASRSYSTKDLDNLKILFSTFASWFFKMIDDEDSLKDNVDNIAHEIQTRFQAVIATSENLAIALSNQSLQEERRLAYEVLNSALAIDTVIQNIGEYFDDYHFSLYSIDRIISKSVHIYKPEADRRRVIIELNVPQGPKNYLDVSIQHIQHAFNNLIHNAVKYSYRGNDSRTRTVNITSKIMKDYFKITIENFGIGILPEEIKKGLIFNDRYQGKLRRGEDRSGIGKGLFITQKIIHMHNGYIEVQSEQQGDDPNPQNQPHLNSFHIYLPYEQPGKDSENEENDSLD